MIERLSHLSRAEMVVGGLFAGGVALSVYCVVKILILMANLEKDLKNSCVVPNNSGSSSFEIASCDGPNNGYIYFTYLIPIALLILGVIIIRAYVNPDSIAAFMAVMVMVGSFFLLFSYASILVGVSHKFENEASVSQLADWTHDRYGEKLSNENALKLLQSRDDSESKKKESPTTVRTESGKVVTLTEESDNHFYLTAKNGDELPLKKDSENSKIKK